jgi:hypothetical protein
MSTDAMMGEEMKEEIAEPVLSKTDVLMSPQDVIIECSGEQIRAHSIALRRCEYFATLLDNADLGSYGPDLIKTITLPTTFSHDAKEVRKFIMVLYDTLDNADRHLVHQHISPENIIAFTELAHYFGSPGLLSLFDYALSKRYLVWFRAEEFPWLTQVAIKNHLPLLRAACTTELATNIDGTGLLVHLDKGRGVLCRDPVFMTEVITTLHQKLVEVNQNYTQLARKYNELHEEGAGEICDALCDQDCLKVRSYEKALYIISQMFEAFD